MHCARHVSSLSFIICALYLGTIADFLHAERAAQPVSNLNRATATISAPATGTESTTDKSSEGFSAKKHLDLALKGVPESDVYETAQMFERTGSNLAPLYYRYLAEKGDAPSQYALGSLYYAGRIVKQNDEKAFDWFLKAAEGGHIKAQNDVGVLYLEGRGTRKDTEKAFEWIERAANKNNLPAMMNLGRIYLQGIGKSKDEKEALRWFLKAADLGSPQAKILVAEMHLDGKGGVQPNLKEAAEWYTSAAQGSSDAKNNAGVLFKMLNEEANKPEAITLFHEAAEAGNPAAQMNLANHYYQGEGVEKNLTEAFKWYLKAAEQNVVGADWNLAVMYQKGEGVDKNLTEAIKWFEKAALRGDTEAAFTVGNLYYEKKEEDIQNLNQAERWLRAAAEAKHGEAQFNLGYLYFEKGPKQNIQEAIKWYRLAAEQNVSEAQVNLAMLHLYGEGMTQDYEAGIRWLKKGVERGNAQGMYNLGMLYLTGLTEGQDIAKTLHPNENIETRKPPKNSISHFFEKTILPKDRSKAITLLKEAAQKGHPEAQKVLQQMGYGPKGEAPWRAKKASIGTESKPLTKDKT